MRRTMLFALAALLLTLAAGTATIARAADVQSDNLEQMLQNAKTPADHEAIAAYYDREAADAKEKAEMHKKTADRYRSFNLKPHDMVDHCDDFAANYNRIAKNAMDMAIAHRTMAKTAK
jgi:hypothetical protein